MFVLSSWPLGGTYQDCSLTVMYAIDWIMMQIIIRPSSGVRTLGDIKSAVGRLRQSVRAGPAQPMNTAMGRMRRRSMNRN